MENDFATFDRLLTRCAEVAAEPDANASVRRVYEDRLRATAEAFRATHAALARVESNARKEGAEGRAALEAIDKPYRLTRAVAFSYIPTLVLPATLKQQRTDTDKMNALRGLLRELYERDETEARAAEQLAGDFGRLAPDAIREVEEWVQSNKDLQEARDARAAARGPAHERYLAFKDVVRQAYGSRSRQYRRIHPRAAASEDEPTPTE